MSFSLHEMDSADAAREHTEAESAARPRIELDPEHVGKGLAQLVLTVVKLLHEVLEKQSLRRVDDGGLTDEQIEELGLTLMNQAEAIETLRRRFGLDEEDLELDLGSVGEVME